MKYRRLTWDQACRFAAERRRLWACAYDIDNETLYPRRKQTPVEGVLTGQGAPTVRFAMFGANGKLRSSGRVHYTSRQYADTYEEAVELYNELVRERSLQIETLGETVIDDFLPSSECSAPESAPPVYDRRNGLVIPQPERVADFFHRMDRLCRRYGYSLAFDDGIVLEPYSQENMDAIRRAELSLEDSLPGRGEIT